MGGGDHVGPGCVNLRMDGECGPVHIPETIYDLPSGVDQEEVGHLDTAERHSKGVHPELIGPLGIADGDMPGNTFIEAAAGEESEGSGQPFLTVAPFALE
jgi:hypothetical protein